MRLDSWSAVPATRFAKNAEGCYPPQTFKFISTFEGAPSKLGLGGGVHRSRTPNQWPTNLDFNVWNEKKFVEKRRYIHRDPVQRELVARPEDWVWSSVRHYATGETSAVEIECGPTLYRWDGRGVPPHVARCAIPFKAPIQKMAAMYPAMTSLG